MNVDVYLTPVTWVTKLYFESGDKNEKLLFLFAKQDKFIPFILAEVSNTLVIYFTVNVIEYLIPIK